MAQLANGPRLLVVDDNRDAADSLALLLGLWGYHPRVAYDAPTAIALAGTEVADGVLLDLALPGTDGFQLAADLRRRPGWANVSVIAVTGHAEDDHRRRARSAGFAQFLVKPVDPVGLQRLLGDLLRVRLLVVRMETLAHRHAELAYQGAFLTEEARRHVQLLRQKLQEGSGADE